MFSGEALLLTQSNPRSILKYHQTLLVFYYPNTRQKSSFFIYSCIYNPLISFHEPRNEIVIQKEIWINLLLFTKGSPVLVLNSLIGAELLFVYLFTKLCLVWLTDLRFLAQSAGAVVYTDCTSAEGYDPHPPTSVLDMTLNNLMVRFQ